MNLDAVSHSVSRLKIEETFDVIRPYVRRTPIVDTDAGDFGLQPFELCFKLEHLQHAGSFKTRGAFANLLRREVGSEGVVAASGGNHGAAVAFAAMRLHIPAKIFVPSVSSAAKIDRIRRYGAQLVVGGDLYADALAASEEWVAESGAVAVHAFDDPDTLLGQGTLGAELEEQAPDVDTVVVPIGGGGLIGGIAAWFAGRVKIVGVEPRDAPTLTLALAAGYPVDAPAGGIASDSLAPRRVGSLMFPIAQRYVESVILVDDDEIVAAQRALRDVLSQTVEPGGAAAFAALLSGRYVPRPGERVCVVASGGNVTGSAF